MFGPVLYGLVKGLAMTSEMPENDQTANLPDATEPAAQPLNPPEVSAVGAADPSAPTADDARTAFSTQPENTAPVHTFTASHKVTNPDNPASFSIVHSAEMRFDEVIAWLRERWPSS